VVFWYILARPWRLIIFIPAMMAADGFLQAGMHFCGYFGMRGVFNFSLEAGKHCRSSHMLLLI